MASERIQSSDDPSAERSPAPAQSSTPAASSGSSGSGGSSGSADTPQNPDEIVRDIERTRADLAEKLDAIADRVSPKKVARRSQDQAIATLKEKAAVAKVVLAEKAAQAKELIADKSGTAKTTLTQKSASTRELVAEKAGTAKSVIADKVSHGGGDKPSLVKDTSGSTELPPVSGVEVPGLAPETPIGSTEGSSTYVSASPPVRVELIAGGVAALLGLWLLRRRR